jgi:hypothetical protein
MSEDADRIVRLVEFKKKLEKKIGELDAELKEQQALLETVNSLLLEKGFKRAEIAKVPVEAHVTSPQEEAVGETKSSSVSATVAETENVIPLKSAGGVILAILYVQGDSLRVLPSEDRSFTVNTPPFTQFLVERVFVKMQERDCELVRAGQLPSERMFSYNIVREGDVIKEIVISNVDADRLRELKSSIRWTFEKMYEKMQS